MITSVDIRRIASSKSYDSGKVIREHYRSTIEFYGNHVKGYVVLIRLCRNNNKADIGFYIAYWLQTEPPIHEVYLTRNENSNGALEPPLRILETRALQIFANMMKNVDNCIDSYDRERINIKFKLSQNATCSKCKTVLDLFDYQFQDSLRAKRSSYRFRDKPLTSTEIKEIQRILSLHLCYHCSSGMLYYFNTGEKLEKR